MEDIKKVPVLRFPEFSGEWEVKMLEDIATFSKGKGISKADIVEDGDLECIRYGELYTVYGETIKNVKSKTNLTKDGLVLSKFNDVIIPASGETQLDIATASCVLKDNIALGGDLNIIRTKLNGVFLSYYLNNTKRHNIASLSQGVSVVHLYATQLKSLNLNIPLKEEQQKIADFLTKIDTKIEHLSKKKKLLESYKKGVMQKIFSQKVRFVDNDGKNYTDWKEKEMGGFLIHRSTRNKSNEIDLVLSVSNKKGFITQNEQFNGYSVASKDTYNYKVVVKNDFAYNPSRINVGSIARLKYFEKGIVSPMYVVFKLKENLNNVFFENLYTTHNFKYLIKIGCSGSVRDSLNFNDLEKFKVKIPSIEEQKKIANFLTEIDNKINLVEKQLTDSQQYKKSLLQKMFI